MHWSLIYKYLSEQCTETEQAQVEQWLNEDPDHQIFLKSVQKIWEVAPKKEAEVDVETAWKHFRANNADPLAKQHAAKPKQSINFKKHTYRSRRTWYPKKSVYAAAAAVALLAAVLFMLQPQKKEPVPITFKKVVTKAGERAKVILTDGSQVELNGESLLKIPSNYGISSRTVFLKGEAFFSVEHNAKRPFSVHTKNLSVKDIGTEFNINAYDGDVTTKVVVAEGKVKLDSLNNNEKSPTYLTAFERAVVSGNGKVIIGKVHNLSKFIGWRKGKLVFEDTPLRKVIKELERWYGVRCDVSDSTLLSKKLTATFNDRPLSDVLLLMSKAMNIEVKRDNRHVKFTPKNKQAKPQAGTE